MYSQNNLTVIGGGSFGTALAEIFGSNGKQVKIWMRNPETAAKINEHHENTRYFPGYKLSPNVVATTDIQEAVEFSELIFISIPSKVYREVAVKIGDYAKGDQILVSTTKGIENKTFKFMSQILEEETCCLKIGALSGPNLAGELMDHQPSGTVIASNFQEVLSKVQAALACPHLRVYANSDIQGVELGGTLKNIYAICSGLISALKMGENTRSLMMARGISEMSRFANILGANPMTLVGLAGVGDLIATCSSSKSRNFQIGYQLGLGKSLDEAVKNLGQTAEGIGTIQVVRDKAKELNLYMPIVSGMYDIVYNNIPVQEVLKNLMSLSQQEDIEFQVK